MSVLVPLYNHERFVGDCLRSIAAQDYPRIELLVADDCSTDGSLSAAKAALRGLEDRFERVLVYSNRENLGVCGSLNGLIRLSCGSLVKALASDDILPPGAVSRLASHLQEYPEEGCVLSNVAMVAPDASYPSILDDNLAAHYATSPIPPQGQAKALYEEGDNLLVSGLMVRRSLYERLGGYDESLSVEDWEWWLRIFSAGERAGWCESVCALYRIVPGSLSHPANTPESHRKLERTIRDELRVLDRYGWIDGVDAREALRKFGDSRISACLKAGYDEGVRYLLESLRERGVDPRPKTRLKILLHRVGLY